MTDVTEAPKAVHAFRCNNCGHLHHGEHAGENTLPAACVACGKGVTHDGGRWKRDDANWEVLADATPERLAELGLSANDVERHAPPTFEAGLQLDCDRIQKELDNLAAKDVAWEANKAAWFAEHKQLDKKLNELDKALTVASHVDYPRFVVERAKVAGRMKELVAAEVTPRDVAMKLHLQSRLAEHAARIGSGEGPGRVPKSFFAHARDGVGADDLGQQEVAGK